jgi:hypothetical protein
MDAESVPARRNCLSGGKKLRKGLLISRKRLQSHGDCRAYLAQVIPR